MDMAFLQYSRTPELSNLRMGIKVFIHELKDVFMAHEQLFRK
jgi:hypothetical protein